MIPSIPGQCVRLQWKGISEAESKSAKKDNDLHVRALI